jgi:hypothetical protein
MFSLSATMYSIIWWITLASDQRLASRQLRSVLEEDYSSKIYIFLRHGENVDRVAATTARAGNLGLCCAAGNECGRKHSGAVPLDLALMLSELNIRQWL